MHSGGMSWTAHRSCESRVGLSLGPSPEEKVFFTLNSWQLALVLAGIMFGATILGLWAGRSLSHHRDTLREPFGVVQAALLTLVGLVLAFGLAMAVGRYDSRRAAVVNDANAIGTAYLRAQTLHEPVRSLSLPLFVRYADASIALSRVGARSRRPEARDRCTESVLQRRLWRLAGEALDGQPTQSAPRLYVESLNEMIDMQTTRVSALNNRVPSAILARRGDRGSGGAGAAGALPRDALARCRHRAARRRPAHVAPLRHLRPRPASARIHQGPGSTLDRAPRLDGATPGRQRTTSPLDRFSCSARRVRIDHADDEPPHRSISCARGGRVAAPLRPGVRRGGRGV